jgi:TonB family protein
VTRFPILFLAAALLASGLASSANEESASTIPTRQMVLVKGKVPEYPVEARRFNVQGAVTAKILVSGKGKVTGIEILRSPADILSDSVRHTVRKYVFEKPGTPAATSIRFPFELGAGHYAFATALRTRTAGISQFSELDEQPFSGSSDVRLMISPKGEVSERLFLRSSTPDFRRIAEKVVDSLRFEGIVPPSDFYAGTTVNVFHIDGSVDGTISIFQRSGE